MKWSIVGLLLLGILFGTNQTVEAISDPLTQPNNKFGIHIFDASEIDAVGDLVNGPDGEWGYVTVPIRSDDRNREKWNAFMRKAGEKKLIPIVRLATTMTPYGWSKPTYFDDIDFANFLNDLEWPVKNRYIVVYNEPNHATEWGGTVNPVEYAEVLARTVQTFKDRNDDFFILPAALDAAAPNDSQHMKWRQYLLTMHASYPQALAGIDGWNSHSYPNPAFSGSPADRHDHSIISFQYERDLIKQLTGKDLPIFITETGWSNQGLSDETICRYFELAFNSVWNNSEIVAVTPFVLQAGEGPFQYFSFLDKDGNKKPQYTTFKNLQRIKGEPHSKPEKTSETILPVLGSSTTATPAPFITQENQIVWDKIKEWLQPKGFEALINKPIN